jgi:hypothetical protein
MSKGLVGKLFVCLFAFGLCLYSYIDKQNALTALRIRIPNLAKQVAEIQEENMQLHYEIDRFENPQHLMELARHSEFSHLKHPLGKEVLTVREGLALQQTVSEPEHAKAVKPKPTLAVGTKN